ncbi:hypothetical protein KC19_10G126300 [Ceratodon purpureus]|uniref:Delta(3)-Delta(2)-enoyl-CoA isomerase n=1 Tax=Ceratodon purpureus TaxID=3225 RepID=A0A8T0GL61_CERPU|nr:hypothetical protein KC19_10G126300 [Ceratodon purpureus]
MCSLERIGDVYVLCFEGDVDEHRLNPALCEEIMEKLAIVNASDAGALVTTNEGKFFSNGLDLAWRDQDPSTRTHAQSVAFNSVLEAFLRVNVPTIAAICGHAAAGGFILALAHDHRHMFQERGFLYMSELDVKILIPPKVMSLIRSKLSPRAFKEVVLKASKLTASQAKDLEIVDSAHPTPAATLEAALAEASQLASRKWNKDLYLNMRLTMYPEVVARLEAKL